MAADQASVIRWCVDHDLSDDPLLARASFAPAAPAPSCYRVAAVPVTVPTCSCVTRNVPCAQLGMPLTDPQRGIVAPTFYEMLGVDEPDGDRTAAELAATEPAVHKAFLAPGDTAVPHGHRLSLAVIPSIFT